MKIKDICENNRPIERLLEKGEESLSNAELLAIILKTGTKENNVLDLCNIVLKNYSLNDIENVEINQLLKIKGIGKIKACQIKAVYELHKRFSKNILKDNFKIYSPKDVYEYLKNDLENKEQEYLVGIYLNGNKIISKKIITIGTHNQTLISNKDILLHAIRQNANAIILAHNHPSGEAYPSQEDRYATDKLKKFTKDLDINLIDHLIITKESYFSFKEKNLL